MDACKSWVGGGGFDFRTCTTKSASSRPDFIFLRVDDVIGIIKLNTACKNKPVLSVYVLAERGSEQESQTLKTSSAHSLAR